MGVRAQIYRSALGDCSNGGISSRAREVTIVNADGPFEPTPEAPAAMIVEGLGPGGTARVVPAVPAGDGTSWVPEARRGAVGPMAGACFVSGDSRVTEKAEEIIGGRFYGALALHDRFETAAQYASYD